MFGIVEIDVTKNNASKESDCLIIAVYDDNDILIDLKYMKGLYNQNQTITFGTMINSIDNKIRKYQRICLEQHIGYDTAVKYYYLF